jgi:hypothetical protein
MTQSFTVTTCPNFKLLLFCFSGHTKLSEYEYISRLELSLRTTVLLLMEHLWDILWLPVLCLLLRITGFYETASSGSSINSNSS